MKKSDYEKLLKLGYTEEEIKIALNGLSTVSLDNQGNELGPNRDDRAVTVKDREGTQVKTSSIMMGYNKQGIRLENGDYVSFDDFNKAFTDMMKEDKEDTVYICKKTGKKISKSQVINDIFTEVVNANSI